MKNILVVYNVSVETQEKIAYSEERINLNCVPDNIVDNLMDSINTKNRSRQIDCVHLTEALENLERVRGRFCPPNFIKKIEVIE